MISVIGLTQAQYPDESFYPGDILVTKNGELLMIVDVIWRGIYEGKIASRSIVLKNSKIMTLQFYRETARVE